MGIDTASKKKFHLTHFIWLLIIVGVLLNIGMVGILKSRLYSFSEQSEKSFNIENQFHVFLRRLDRVRRAISADAQGLLSLGDTVEEKTVTKEIFDDVINQIAGSGYAGEFAEELDELKKSFMVLEQLTNDAVHWRQRYLPISHGIKSEEVLNEVRDMINEAQRSIVSFEGKARLEESLLIRKYRGANRSQMAEIAEEYFNHLQKMRGVNLLDIKKELSDLALFIERLAGEGHRDHLADLKDNQIKQALNRLKSGDDIFKRAEIGDGIEWGEWIKRLETLIFGEGYVARDDIQTIVPGQGGLYQLYWDYLELIRQRDLLGASIDTQMSAIERSSVALSRKVEAIIGRLEEDHKHLLARTWNNILFFALLFMIIFSVILWQIVFFIRRQVEKMEESANEVHAILEGVGDAMRVVDKDFNILRLNHQMEVLSGTRKEDAIGKKCSDQFSGDTCRTEMCTLTRILNGEERVQAEMIKKTGKGKDISVEMIATPLKVQGKIVGMIESFRNITERKKMEERLQQANHEIKKASEDLEIKIGERTSELAVLYEISNAISYTSDFQRLLDLAMESVLKVIDYDICSVFLFDGEKGSFLIKPVYAQSQDYTEKTRQNVLKEFSLFNNVSIADDKVSLMMLPVAPGLNPETARPSGELKSSFFSPLLIKGKVEGILNIASAREGLITEDKAKFINTVANQVANALERLRTMVSVEKSKMESMVESMLEGVIMLDTKGDIVVLNPQAREMLDIYAQGQEANNDLYDRMKLVNLDTALDDCIRKDELIERDIVMPHNQLQALQCDILPVKSDGKRVGTTIILRDVTKEKKVDTMKTEFISTVSHELRTPLAITKEGLSLILDKVAGDITEKQAMILSTAKDNMDRLERLINNVLDISKIEAGKMDAKKEQMNIAALAKDVLSTFEMKAKERNLELRANFSQDVMDVFADRDKMIQVFTNLINNAVKFTPSGHIEISGELKENQVWCAVTDTGIGISKENLKNVFGKFQQFGRVPGSGEKGTGLGLSIAKGIIEMHNGNMWVESEVEVGTKFLFTLPKFELELPLKEFVRNGIDLAQKSGGRMAIIRLELFKAGDPQEALFHDKRETYLKGIEKVLNENLHREGDAVLCDGERYYIILVKCNEKYADVVCERLKAGVGAYLTKEQLIDTVAVEVGYAVYPDDAGDHVQLLEKVNAMPVTRS